MKPIVLAYATRAEAVAELLESKVEKRKDLLLPGRRKLLSALVVTSETVDTALDHNQAEFGVTVLSVALKMLADGNSLLDEEVHILRQRGSQSYKSPTNHHSSYRSSSGV